MQTFSENIIVADAQYIDSVAFDLTVNFERMLGRRIPPADMARWADCAALDGGVRGEENTIDVVLVHSEAYQTMENCSPSKLKAELDAQACKSPLGELVFHTLATTEVTTVDEALIDLAATLAKEESTRRLIIVPNGEHADALQQLRHQLQQADTDKHITLLTMQPTAGGNYRQEMLGYSLLQALGISAEEVNSKIV